MWASDSLFLRQHLLIPVNDSGAINTIVASPSPPASVTSPISNSSFDDDDNVQDFLGKIDAAIASTKEEVKKSEHHSE